MRDTLLVFVLFLFTVSGLGQTSTASSPVTAPQAAATTATTPAPPPPAPDLTDLEKAAVKEKLYLLNANDLRYQLAVSQQAQYQYAATHLKSDLSHLLFRLGSKHNIPSDWTFDFNTLRFGPASQSK